MRRNIKCILGGILIMLISCNYLYAADPELKWDEATGDVSGYIIYYGTSQGSYPFSQDVGNITQYALSNFSLSEGTTYYFTVRAYNTAGESSNSNVAVYTVPDAADTTPPLSPQGVAGEVVENDVLLTWTANSEPDCSGYRVYYGASTRDYGLPIPVVGTEYSVTGLDVDSTYYFAVTAVDASGNESGYSSPEVTKTLEDTTAPAVTITLPTWGDNYPKDSDSIDIGGTASDAVGVTSVTWASDKGGSGTASGTTNWNITEISLVEGSNVITVTASDAAGNTATDTLTVWYEIPDTTAPVVTIASPTTETSYETESSSISLNGTATDDTGISSVIWSNSRGVSGTAVGTSSWSVSDIALGEGENVITIAAEDAAGNTSVDTLTVIYTIPDTTAPIITITSPTTENSYEVETTSLELSGTGSDETGVVQVLWSNSRGGSGTASGTENWTVSDIILGEGENLITVVATDDAGNSSSDTLRVMYTISDTTSPVVTIISPTTGASYETESSSINLSGTATDDTDTSSVTWSNSRGGSGEAAGTDSWSVSGIALGEGENVITISAEDTAGNTSTDVLIVISTISDTTAPVITITSPTWGDNYPKDSDSIDIGGTASDAVGVTSVSWASNKGGSGIASGTTNWNITGISLVEGANVITVTASDATGNTAADTLTVWCELPDTTAPSVTINSPTADNTYSIEISSLELSGTALDETGVVQVLWSNSRGGSGTASGTDNWTVSGIVLGEGENQITVTAKDDAGNASTDTLIVTYTIPDTTSPVVTITTPTSGTNYNIDSDTINISGTAADDTSTSNVTWSNSRGGSGTAAGTANWNITGVALAEGENVITVMAKDTAGNTSTDILTVMYTVPDTTAPVATITSPTAGNSMTIEVSNMEISGTASDDTGVAQVTWSNSRGGSGTATGTENWSVSGIPLGEGENLISVHAKDTSGNVSTDTLTVVYFVPETSEPEEWSVLSNDNFESGWGSFVDGGTDCRRSARDAKYAHQGTYSARIRDNSGKASSFYYKNSVDVSTPGYSQIKIAFWYYPVSMENKEDFFVQFYNGSKWVTVGRYIKGTDFQNDKFYQEKGILINKDEGVVFPTNMKIRFRCDASGNGDKIYIDEVVVSAR